MSLNANIGESTERIIRANGVDLCLETFGDAAAPPILLIAGAAASMDWWEDEFCRRLAAGPRFVIRYDNRDTGRSVSYEAGSPGYGQPDLAADAVGVLDALGVTRGHLVGISMGGGIAQRIAVEHPERVATLTLMSTSPGGPGGPDNPELPPMAERIVELFSTSSPDPDWSDRVAVADRFVSGEQQFAGSLPVDEARIRAIAGRVFDRTENMAASQTNHWTLDGGEPVRERLPEITAPTLVLHGTEDPLLPYGHAEALARAIPGAHLVPLDKVGHQMPPPEVWDVVVQAVLSHTA